MVHKMAESKKCNENIPPPPVGSIEPHAALLNRPPDDQLLYKVMRVEDLLRSISGSYLHFNRVDSYKDFQGADAHDGQQLPKDRHDNAMAKFAKAPSFSVEDYYNQCRARTYACCFSVENSDHTWRKYGNGGKKGKACVVFKFSQLRSRLNKTLQAGNSALEYNGKRCHQIFSVNYGLVEYVVWKIHQANMGKRLNPIKYTYFKDRESFENEKELRISLSAIGIGQFSLIDGSVMEFPAHLQVAFDFRAAIADGTIQKILYSPDCDLVFLHSELNRLGIELREERA